MLRKAELRVLIALHDDPIGDIKSLSKRAGISPVTFVRNLRKLQAEGILGWEMGPDRVEGFVSAQINYSTLGFQQITIFISVPHRTREAELNKVEEMCEAHPYTAYRARCLGSTNGVFAIFAVPLSSSYLLFELLNILKEKNIIADYIHRDQANRQVLTETDFRLYDRRTGTWRFDWNSWAKGLSEGDESYVLKPMSLSILHKLGSEDIRMLSQLSVDARKEKARIAKEIGIPAYQLSRRRKFCRNNDIMEGYRVLYGHSSLNLVTPGLIDCENASIGVKTRVACAFSRLPFQGSFIPTEKGFILYSILPARSFPRLAGAILDEVGETNLMLCDYENTVRYWFDSQDESNYRDGAWLATREHMVNNVLRDIGLD